MAGAPLSIGIFAPSHSRHGDLLDPISNLKFNSQSVVIRLRFRLGKKSEGPEKATRGG
jgi:hypothetical protein